jgi:hypothetical protein
MVTPIKKPANRDLLDWEREFNKQINKIRYVANGPSPTSKRREFFSRTTDDRKQHSHKPLESSSHSTHTGVLNNPHHSQNSDRERADRAMGGIGNDKKLVEHGKMD